MPTIRRPTTARQVVSLQTDTHAPTSGPFTIGESSLNSSGASAGTYGDATHVGQFTLGADGRITSASDVLITAGAPGGSSGQVQYNNSGAFGGFTFSGDLTVVTSTGVATLASTTVTPGSYTNANITVDAKGRVTAAANGSGGSGGPGGTSGQIQYNSSGSFGGFTMSGDATTNTSTGALTLATVNSNVGTFGDSTHVAQVTVNAKGLVTAASDVAVTASGSLIGIRYFTSGTGATYTPTSGTNSVVIELQGGGGGGAGSATASGSTVAWGISGNGGAWLRVRLAANFSGGTYTIGGAGTGGSAGGNNGNNGGNTTFTTSGGSPTTYTAAGGAGGASSGASHFGPPYIGNNISTPAGATNGDISRAGGQGGLSGGHAAFYYMAGAGGSSYYSPGAIQGAIENGSTNGQLAGANDVGPYGGGGGGSVVAGTGSAVAGGDGTPGVMIIYEYS